jgi:hypothetical protein
MSGCGTTQTSRNGRIMSAVEARIGRDMRFNIAVLPDAAPLTYSHAG